MSDHLLLEDGGWLMLEDSSLMLLESDSSVIDDGIEFAGTQRAPVLYSAASRPLMYDRIQSPQFYDTRQIKTFYCRARMPIIFKVNN